MDRRTFLKGAGLAAATALGAGPRPAGSRAAWPGSKPSAPPNILFIMVDQLRYPQWFPSQDVLDGLLPGMARLRDGAVSFGQHYTAANACTPARSCLLTGLYAHQTGCLLTATKPGGPSSAQTTAQPAQSLRLYPGFSTWGAMLRRFGYKTTWFGKWHLSDDCNLEPYGFGGGTCPSPNGLPGQGFSVDPQIADQFSAWFDGQGGTEPWCTAVSFVNPHDISWYYRYSLAVLGERNPPSVFNSLPPNFETAQNLDDRQKPRLQLSLQNTANAAFGPLPFSGQNFEFGWLRMLDLYLQLQRYVDAQIGNVLDALEASPNIAARTIVVFTSDHGEYGGSHGLRGKGGAAYDEAIRVPLYVKDPTGRWARQATQERTALTSSVDIAPLLLTLASGGNALRKDPRYAHLAGRLDLAALLHNPRARGRSYVLHTTDETFAEGGATASYAKGVPAHVIGYRTATAKLGLYSLWKQNTLDIVTSGQELECYDYKTPRGRMELDNVAASNPVLCDKLLNTLVHDAIPHELRRPLPDSLRAAQQAGFQEYLAAAQATTASS